MTDRMSDTGAAGAADDGAGMTLRVYSVNRGGIITEDTGTRAVTPGEPMFSSTYPPCSCPRCNGR